MVMMVMMVAVATIVAVFVPGACLAREAGVRDSYMWSRIVGTIEFIIIMSSALMAAGSRPARAASVGGAHVTRLYSPRVPRAFFRGNQLLLPLSLSQLHLKDNNI